MLKRCIGIALATAGLGLAGSAQAAAVFEQLPDYRVAVYSDASGPAPNYRIADNFTLAATSEITSVDFWGEYYPVDAPTDSFTIDFYADSGGFPGPLVYSQAGASGVRVDTNTSVSDLELYQYSVNLTGGFAAAGGVQYWISVTNDTHLNGGGWGWATGYGDSKQATSDTYGSTWFHEMGGWDVSFRLNTVPAPSSLALVGLAGLASARRRR